MNWITTVPTAYRRTPIGVYTKIRDVRVDVVCTVCCVLSSPLYHTSLCHSLDGCRRLRCRRRCGRRRAPLSTTFDVRASIWIRTCYHPVTFIQAFFIKSSFFPFLKHPTSRLAIPQHRSFLPDNKLPKPKLRKRYTDGVEDLDREDRIDKKRSGGKKLKPIPRLDAVEQPKAPGAGAGTSGKEPGKSKTTKSAPAPAPPASKSGKSGTGKAAPSPSKGSNVAKKTTRDVDDDEGSLFLSRSSLSFSVFRSLQELLVEESVM